MIEQRIAYHYTRREQWDIMNHGRKECMYYKPGTRKTFKSSKVRGLWPRDEFIPSYIKNFPREAHCPVTYALTEPEPQSWISKGDAWPYLMQYLTDQVDQRLVLLKIHLLPTDRALVVDAALLLKIEEEESEVRRKELYRQRWETRIPLWEYNDKAHALPEIIIPTAIPLERLKKVWEKDAHKVYRKAKRVYEQLRQ